MVATTFSPSLTVDPPVKQFLCEWGVQLRLWCVYVPSGNSIAERSHCSIKRIAARKQCTIAEATYWYNVIPKDGMSPVTTPTNVIYMYQVRGKGNWHCAVTWRQRGLWTICCRGSSLDETPRHSIYHQIQEWTSDWCDQSAICPGQWSPMSHMQFPSCFGDRPFNDWSKWWVIWRQTINGLCQWSLQKCNAAIILTGDDKE